MNDQLPLGAVVVASLLLLLAIVHFYGKGDQ